MRNEKVLLEATICFVRRGNEVLLARKTRNIGMGCLNGYGGGLEEGETEKECAVRELFKESEISALVPDLKKIAEVYFYNTKKDGGTFMCKCHVYEIFEWRGRPVATEEMEDPRWFSIDDLPFGEMMPADPFWLPYIFSGKKFVVTAHYGPFQKNLLAPVSVKEIKEF